MKSTGMSSRLLIPVEFVLFLFSGILFFENLDSHVVDSGVVENNDTAVGTRFDVHSDILAELIVHAAEVVTNGLNGRVEFVGDTCCCTVGQTVFESAKLVE